MNRSVNIRNGMVDDLMGLRSSQSIVGSQRIAVQHSPGLEVLAKLNLEFLLSTVCHYRTPFRQFR